MSVLKINNSLCIRQVSEFNQLLKLEPAWNRLLKERQDQHVCLSFEWLRCWWSAFAKDKKLFVLLFEGVDGDIQGIAPLMVQDIKLSGICLRRLLFIRNENSLCNDFLITPGREEEVLGKFLGYLKYNRQDWDILELEGMPAEALNSRILKRLIGGKGFFYGVKDGLNSPYISINSSWKDYFANRSKKLRKNIRNIRNRLDRSGPWGVEMVENGKVNNSIFEEIFNISCNSWKRRINQQMNHSQENQDFFQRFFNGDGGRVDPCLWLLKVKNTPVAYEYHLKYQGNAYALRADFRQDYQKLSCGSALHAYIVQYYFENGIKLYDFCGHQDAYKVSWAQKSLRHVNWTICRPNLKGGIYYLFNYRFLYHLKSFLKRFSILRRLQAIRRKGCIF